MMFAFGMHGALWTIVGSSLRQRLTPPDMLGRVGSANLFIAAGGQLRRGRCSAAPSRPGSGSPPRIWAGFVVAVIVSATTWRVFDRATVAAGVRGARCR